MVWYILKSLLILGSTPYLIQQSLKAPWTTVYETNGNNCLILLTLSSERLFTSAILLHIGLLSNNSDISLIYVLEIYLECAATAAGGFVGIVQFGSDKSTVAIINFVFLDLLINFKTGCQN